MASQEWLKEYADVFPEIINNQLVTLDADYYGEIMVPSKIERELTTMEMIKHCRYL